ncbi:4Fe-4S binding protein [Orrella sp. 11846]|uniref:4Fe-4S binding protein n=1 Tax=Orrella sp. 11846 TaxID=3409913 RepID=UPI003B5C523F
MRHITQTTLPTSPNRLSKYAIWLRDHRQVLQYLQWGIVVVYLFLLLIPLLLPLPERINTIFDHLTLTAQWAFWGVWWPFVLLSIVVAGRTWCGLFCPEGTLTEWASRHGKGKAIPRWVRWSGWPLTAFCLTTIYGQLISVYQYPAAAALVLGGSTVAAMIVGWLYGRERRVWCRYLCPVTGVFALLAKLAPWHYRVDAHRWREPTHNKNPIVCAPLLPLRHMTSASDCHMCARCQDYRGAIQFSARSCNAEILYQPTQNAWQTYLIVFGLMGLAPGAFQWSQSTALVEFKQSLAYWLIEHDIVWPLHDNAPWFILTHYPALNDSLNWLDGLVMLLYMVLAALGFGVWLLCHLQLAKSLLKRTLSIHKLAQGLIPLAGAGVFIGLSATTLSLLKPYPIATAALQYLRIGVLSGAILWSIYLLWTLTKQSHVHSLRRLIARIVLIIGAVPSIVFWARFLIG